MTKRADIDWASIELEYRAGIKSLRTIGSQFGITDAAIIKRAKRDGWERDLKARIQAATEAKLLAIAEKEQKDKEERNQALLEAQRREAGVQEELAVSIKQARAKKLVSEELTVDAAANKRVGTVTRQGERIDRLTALSDKLTAELVAKVDSVSLLDRLGEIMDSPDENGKKDKLNEIYRRVIDFPSRVTAFKQLVETQKTLIGLERQNVGLADNANGDSDKPAEKAEMSPQEEARRIAFVLASAMHKKGE